MSSNAVECGFGLCPPASKCDETNHMCIPPGCGDGQIAVGAEQCDGPIDPALQLDCTSLDYYSGTLACSPECTFDTSGCSGTCGDHAINGPELCDGMPPPGVTCADFGFQLGRLGCTVDCAPGFGQCASIGWQTGRGNAPDELHAVWGSSAGDMFAVGRGGAILHSGGLLWSAMASPTTQHLHGVWGTGPNNVFAVGDAGTVLRYDGTTWAAMTSGTTANLHAITGTTTEAWIVGDGGTILHGTIASGGWAPETSGVSVVLRGVAATPQGVIAVGDAATTGTASPVALVRQGTTWTAMTVPAITPVVAGSTVTLASVWGENTGFVAVGSATAATIPPHGSVVQTNIANNNTTWAFTGQSLTSQDLHAVWGVSSAQPPPATGIRTDIFIGGLGGALVHYDGVPGPAHFRLENAGTTRGIFGLWGTGPAFVRAATLGGEVQEYDGTDLATTALALPAKNLVGVYQNPATSIAVAVGDTGTVVRHDFSGWLVPATLGAADLHAVAGSGSTVFVAGAGLAVSANDGQSFGGFTFPGVSFFGLWAASATEAWAVGEAGAVAHYTGTWTAAGTAGTRRLNGVWGASSTDLFAVGNLGTIMHYDGMSWTPQTSGVMQNLNAVWGTAGNDVYVAGGAGVILHYDGTRWRTMTSGTGQDLYTVGGTSAGDVWVGGRGTLLHFLGVSWAPVDDGLDDTLGLFVQNTDSFFVGDLAAGAGAITGAGAILGRTLLAQETRCTDPWDNDGDGLVGCADSDCAGEPNCLKGGPCAPSDVLVCDQPTSGATTFTGIARIDDLPCLDHATPGPEAAYRFVAPASGSVTVTLDDPGGHLDIAMLAPLDPVGTQNRRLACDPRTCTAATSSQASGKALTFAATAGETYYLVVDGPAATAEAFTLALSCP